MNMQVYLLLPSSCIRKLINDNWRKSSFCTATNRTCQLNCINCSLVILSALDLVSLSKPYTYNVLSLASHVNTTPKFFDWKPVKNSAWIICNSGNCYIKEI